MEYYAFTKEQIDKMISHFNKVSVTGLEQIDAYSEATQILRHPIKINIAKEGEKKDGICETGVER